MDTMFWMRLVMCEERSFLAVSVVWGKKIKSANKDPATQGHGYCG
jgi:hypothetical protein